MSRIARNRTVRHDKHDRARRRDRHLRPMIRLIGSKGRVRKRLVSMMPTHRVYAEPFVGTGTVLLGKPPVNVEMVNDLNGEIANLLVVLRDQAKELSRMLERTPACQRIYNDLTKQAAEELDAVPRAFRYVYINRNCFLGAGGARSSFAISAKKPRAYDAVSLGRLAIQLQRRLSRVQIYEMGCIEFVKRTDHQEIFYFIDPPYPGCEHYYAAPFSEQIQQSLAKALRNIKGRALVTLPDSAAVRDLYDFADDIQPIDVAYSVAKSARTVGKELAIAIGYTFDEATG